MKIYLAAPWADKDKMEDIGKRFENEANVDITHRWWNTDEHDPELNMQLQASLDLHGVRTAEALVVLYTAKSEGKAIEQGYALGCGVPIIGVDLGVASANPTFSTLPEYIWVKSLDEAIMALKVVNWWKANGGLFKRNAQTYTTSMSGIYGYGALGGGIGGATPYPWLNEVVKKG